MIEIIETTDAALLATLNEEVQGLHHQLYPEVFKPYDKEGIVHFFAHALKEEQAIAFVAMEQGSCLGYILLFIKHYPENPFQYQRKYLLIDQLLVKANFRGRGVGKQLLNQCLKFAEENQLTKLELNHWSNNTGARKFFNQNGFTYFNEKMWRNL